jgi:hypothetical protein
MSSTAALFEEVFDRADQKVSSRVRAAAKAAVERGEDPWSVFLAGWDAILDTAIDEPLQRIRVVDAPAVLGWQRWQERNARYTIANIEAGLVRLLEHGVLAPSRWHPLRCSPCGGRRTKTVSRQRFQPIAALRCADPG